MTYRNSLNIRATLAQKRKRVVHSSFLAVCKRVQKSPTMDGIGSLGNISGGYVQLDSYMRGNYVNDMAGDWKRVGMVIRESMKAF